MDEYLVSKWFGPRGFTSPICKLDLKPGGEIRIEMKGPDGTVYPMNGIFREIAKPDRLIYTSAALDNNGNSLFQVLNTIIFTEDGDKTKIKLTAKVSEIKPEGKPYLDGMKEGWSQTIDRLSEYLEKIK